MLEGDLIRIEEDDEVANETFDVIAVGRVGT